MRGAWNTETVEKREALLAFAAVVAFAFLQLESTVGHRPWLLYTLEQLRGQDRWTTVVEQAVRERERRVKASGLRLLRTNSVSKIRFIVSHSCNFLRSRTHERSVRIRTFSRQCLKRDSSSTSSFRIHCRERSAQSVWRGPRIEVSAERSIARSISSACTPSS